jgi:hypothetical protein
MIGTWHIRHHGRFYLAALAGIAVWLAARFLPAPLPLLVGGDAFFLVYLALMTHFALRITPDGLRRRVRALSPAVPRFPQTVGPCIGRGLTGFPRRAKGRPRAQCAERGLA